MSNFVPISSLPLKHKITVAVALINYGPPCYRLVLCGVFDHPVQERIEAVNQINWMYEADRQQVMKILSK